MKDWLTIKQAHLSFVLIMEPEGINDQAELVILCSG